MIQLAAIAILLATWQSEKSTQQVVRKILMADDPGNWCRTPEIFGSVWDVGVFGIERAKPELRTPTQRPAELPLR